MESRYIVIHFIYKATCPVVRMNNSRRVAQLAQPHAHQFRTNLLRFVLTYAKWVASVSPVWCAMNMANVFHQNCVS